MPERLCAGRFANTLNSYLYILAFLCVVLVYLFVVIYRLRRTSQDFKAINENLEQRVEERTAELRTSHADLVISEANQKALLHAMPDAIWKVDPTGRFLDVIPAQGDNMIVDADNWQGKTVDDVLPPHVAESLKGLAAKTTATGETEILDIVLGRNERVHHFECRIAYCSGSEVLIVVRDVTELKKAVAESHVILETIQGVSTTSNVEELIGHIHASIKRFIYAENFFVALFDRKTRELDTELFIDKYEVKPPPGKLVHGLAGYAFRIGEPMLLTRSAIEQLEEDGEVELVGRSPAVWLGVPLRTPRGSIGILAVQHYEDTKAYDQRDVELLASIGDQIGVAIDRKRAEIEMFDAKSFLNRVIDNVPSLIYVKDRIGRYVLTNKAFADLHGMDVKDIIGKSDLDLHEGSEASRYDRSDHYVLSRKREYVNEEEKVVDADGKVHWLQSVKRPLMGSAGVEYILGIATDLTERKYLEQQLRQAQKLESIGQLAAGIAHEINTPTQYVGDNVRFLTQGFADYSLVIEKARVLARIASDSEFRCEELTALNSSIVDTDIEFLDAEIPRALAQALDGVERISKIVRSIKDFAHPGSNDFKATDLNKALESAITVASNEWKYVANVAKDYDPDLPLVSCLASEMNQVFLNIIVNAAHAIADLRSDDGEKGTISISTRHQDGKVAVTIADTGTGMDENVLKRIFDPFFTTKEVGRGTGQGLAISHRVVVEKHSGTIDVESSVGEGTRFVITLPVRHGSAVASRAINLETPELRASI